ncbi:fatty acid desaturase family protein [Streptomyces olivoreticuli]|uniref:fatty acid desaturase family protein n=1 Tax=Streptomyces olivoreticuli TaxID=68246 RepID=UPI000E226627|nr:fatty acid desaturase [Streptomyces olivoreticuli]
MATPLAEQAGQGIDPLFRRGRVTARDERVFIGKLALCALLVAAGVVLALQESWLAVAAGVVILAATYTHAVELQHQALHHSAFRRPGPHRWVGVPLGAPMLVSYSHYRVRHLQHHRALGTPEDTEFFGFDTRQGVTWKNMLRGLFDVPRLGRTGREIWRACRGTWEYADGQIAPKAKRAVIGEYRLMGAMLIVAAALCALGEYDLVLKLWVLPMLVGQPMHFLVELPEHLLCETDSRDVLRNTRSIQGSRISSWYTNGNNFHVEHHAAMSVPISQLRDRHPEVERRGTYVVRSYPAFYASVVRQLCKPARA